MDIIDLENLADLEPQETEQCSDQCSDHKKVPGQIIAEFNSLSFFDRASLRIGRLTDTLSTIVNDELHRHPWKLFFYIPTPFPMPPPGRMIGFITLNAIYNTFSPTKKAKWARGLVKESWAKTPCMLETSKFVKITKKGAISVRKTKVVGEMWKSFSENVGEAASFHWNKWPKSKAVERRFSKLGSAFCRLPLAKSLGKKGAKLSKHFKARARLGELKFRQKQKARRQKFGI